MVCYSITKFPAVNSSHGEHECRRLRNTLVVSVFHFGSGAVKDVAVTSTVDDALGVDYFPAFLGVDDYSLTFIAFHNYVSSKYIKEYLNIVFIHDFPSESFGSFRIHHGQADMQRTCSMVCSLSPFAESFHKTERQAFDDFIAFASQETEEWQTDGHVSAQVASAVDQHDFGSLYKCSRLSSHNSGRTGAHHEDIHLSTYR